MITGIDLDKKIIAPNPEVDLKRYTSDEMLKFCTMQIKFHRKIVNDIAKKISKEYPEHDEDKMNNSYTHYAYAILWNTKTAHKQTNIPKEIIDEAKRLQHNHHIMNPHHIEHWCSIENFKKPPIDGTVMPMEFIEEMCCDWMSMSVARGQTTLDWFESVIDKNFIFTKNQIDLIRKTINQAEPQEKNKVHVPLFRDDFSPITVSKIGNNER
ncbi:MAG: DUF5662 family protein [Rickettsiales bacterium]|jgi:hypothetical protein|nr:DUF5662 family protein [Rickettsiales bacterium]